VIGQQQPDHPQPRVLVFRSVIDLSGSALQFLLSLLRTRRLKHRARWRRLPADRQALLALAHFAVRHTHAQSAAGFGIGITTAYRYVPRPSRS